MAADSTWRSTGIFLLLATVLSGIFWAFINPTQTVTTAYTFALTWMPGVCSSGT
jgi:ribonuclease I